jgi:hypothetical protein
LQGLSLLLFRYLAAHTCKIREEELCGTSEDNKCRLGDQVVIFVLLTELAYTVERQLHELPYNIHDKLPILTPLLVRIFAICIFFISLMLSLLFDCSQSS